MSHGMGALPPRGFEWMIGRSVAEISAIKMEASLTGKTPSEVAESDDWKKYLQDTE